MRESRFSETRIVEILKEGEAGLRWLISCASTGSAERLAETETTAPVDG